MTTDSSDYLSSREFDSEHEKRMSELARRIQEGIDSLNRGEGIPGEIVKAKLNAKIAAFRLEQ